jgi:hypothetical protein
MGSYNRKYVFDKGKGYRIFEFEKAFFLLMLSKQNTKTDISKKLQTFKNNKTTAVTSLYSIIFGACALLQPLQQCFAHTLTQHFWIVPAFQNKQYRHTKIHKVATHDAIGRRLQIHKSHRIFTMSIIARTDN